MLDPFVHWRFDRKLFFLKFHLVVSRCKPVLRIQNTASLLYVQEEGVLTNKQLRSHALTIMEAGHMTTGLNLSHALYLLGQYPDTQKRYGGCLLCTTRPLTPARGFILRFSICWSLFPIDEYAEIWAFVHVLHAKSFLNNVFITLRDYLKWNVSFAPRIWFVLTLRFYINCSLFRIWILRRVQFAWRAY